MRIAIQQWRINANEKGVQDDVLIHQKQESLTNLNKIFLKSNSDALSTAFEQWKQRCKSSRLIKRALNKLLNSQEALLQRAFDHWREALKRDDLFKGLGSNKLGDRILNIYLSRLRAGLGAVKNAWEEQNQIKRDLFNRLILACQSETQRAFNVWRLHARHLKNIESCKSVLGLFNALRDVTNANLQVVLKVDPVNAEKKNHLMRCFVSVYSGKMFQAFYKWHEFAMREFDQETQKNRQIEQAVAKTEKYMKLELQNQLRDAFLKLKEKINENLLKKGAIQLIIRTKQGSIWDAFNRWRDTVRFHRAAQKHKTRGIVDLKLEKIYQRALRKGFDPLKEEWMSTFEIKRHHVRKWFAVTQGKYREKFEQWKEITQLFYDLNRAKHTLIVFDVVKSALKLNVDAVLQKDAKRAKTVRMFR